MKLINVFLTMAMLVLSAQVRAEAPAAEKPIDIVVYRSPSCGCCGKWLEHMKQNNFNVQDNVTENMQAIKEKYGVSKEMASCHTALVDGYVVEGHVPAADIRELLRTKPKVTGIAVPGMVSGTPGMEMGGRKEPYQVMSFDAENHYQIFKNHAGD